MTLEEFAKILDGRSYGNEITKEEEALAKELGFVVVFGYSDDNVELRGAIDDEIGCYEGGLFEHEDLPSGIYADWCPDDIDCSWAYGTEIPHESFHIFDGDDLYCVGIVCDINKPKPTNGDRIRAMTDEELALWLDRWCRAADDCVVCPLSDNCPQGQVGVTTLDWLKQPAEEEV